MSWTQTFSGVAFDLLDPKPEMVKIEDIAHHLSQINRFTGATSQPYSVAQHSVLVAGVLPDNLKLAGLLHDAKEAWIGDISTPVKDALGRLFLNNIEWLIDTAMCQCVFPPDSGEGCQHEWYTLRELIHNGDVKNADLRMMLTEKRDLLGRCDREWEWAKGLEPYEFTITPWSASVAEGRFLEAFYKLTKKEEAACL